MNSYFLPRIIGIQCDPLVFMQPSILYTLTKIHRVKYNFSLKTPLQQGILEPVSCGDLVYKFKIMVGKGSFYYQFKKIINHY